MVLGDEMQDALATSLIATVCIFLGGNSLFILYKIVRKAITDFLKKRKRKSMLNKVMLARIQ